MVGIDVGMQQAYRYRRRLTGGMQGHELVHHCCHRRLVEWHHHRAVGRQSFGDFQPVRTSHQRLGAVNGGVVQAGAILPANLDDIGEPCGGHQCNRTTRTFQHRIGGHGGAVGEHGGGSISTEQGGEAQTHGTPGVIRGGRDLGDAPVVSNQVSKGPPGVRAHRASPADPGSVGHDPGATLSSDPPERPCWDWAASTARASTRSLPGSSLCPLTHLKVMPP